MDSAKHPTATLATKVDRRRAALRLSLDNPHPETLRLSEEGLAEWARSLPEENVNDFIDIQAGTPIRWIPGQGWVEGHA